MASLLGTLSFTTIFSKVVERIAPKAKASFGVDVHDLIPVIIGGAMVYTSATYIYGKAWDLINDHYSCTIRIISQDAMFAALMQYLEEEAVFITPKEAEMQAAELENQKVSSENADKAKKTAKSSSVLHVSKAGGFFSWYAQPTRHLEAILDDWDANFPHDYPQSYSNVSDSDCGNASFRNRKKLKYSPAPKHEDYFYYKPTGHIISILREEMPRTSSPLWNRRPKEALTLSVLGKDLAPLKSLLQDVVDWQNTKDHGRTTVYKARQGADGYGAGAEWVRCFSKPVRSMDTVILDNQQKREICEDIEEFLLPATNKWYSNRGLPYRRGYLLYGPPGTGKTSLSVALAGAFVLSIYSLSLSVAWMNDDTLALLFSRLPRNCIVLLEDIDACGVARENGAEAETKYEPPPSNNTNRNNNGGNSTPAARVSLSGLLNAIDGVASKEGRVLIMTTNHRERLDEALIRPGRVDLQIKFKYADREIIHGLFRALYAISDTDKQMLRFPDDFPEPEEIAKLSDEFAEKVPEGIFSPAEVQGFLLKSKKNPRGAVATADAWVKQALEEKREKERKEKENEEAEKQKKEKREKDERERKEEEEKERKEKKEQEKRIQSEKEKSNAAIGETPLTNGLKSHDTMPLTNGVSKINQVDEVGEVATNGGSILNQPDVKANEVLTAV
ncbi:P-loop containing nucleoside triphosphate hydrolase protein [Kalaharituber pfeilii]|nr:P-loop containing nucleoside triphosphate hydrolase protein [Kalaharituber pfeilii]